MKYYTLCDKVARELAPAFMAKNDDVAKRMVINMLKDKPMDNPSEYALVSLFEVNNDCLEAPTVYQMIQPVVANIQVICESLTDLNYGKSEVGDE